jgi:hypothetical protein
VPGPPPGIESPDDGPGAPLAGAVLFSRSCLVSWSRRFEEPIELPDGRTLKTLAEAMAWLRKKADPRCGPVLLAACQRVSVVRA